MNDNAIEDDLSANSIEKSLLILISKVASNQVFDKIKVAYSSDFLTNPILIKRQQERGSCGWINLINMLQMWGVS